MSKSNNIEIIPEESSDKVGPACYQLVMDIIEDKSSLGLHDKWLRWYELGRNKHWKKKSDAVPQVSVNLLDKHRQKLINQLTDNNPTFNVRSAGAIPEEQAELVNKLLKAAEYWWNETEQQKKLADSVYNGETYGIAIEKVIFNPELELGIGETETVTVDPFHFGLWPVKTLDVQKAQACVHYYPRTLREVRRLWPDSSDKVKSDAAVIQDLGEDRREVNAKESTTAMMIKVGTTVSTVLGMSADQTGDGDDDETLVCEIWVKDYSKTKEGENKYPGNIRRITICSMGKVVLEDVPNPSINPNLPIEQASITYLFDKFPFIDAHAKEDTATFWSASDFENLEDLNLELDKSISQFKIGKDKATRSKLINPKTSGVTNEQLNNVPGIINPTTFSHGIEYIMPPPLPPDIMASIEMYKGMFMLMSESFVGDSTQAPGRDVIAYKAIAALIEQATISLRGKIRSYSRMIRERGRMYLSHLMNWYTEDRWITFDEEGQDKMDKVNGRELLLPVKLSVVSGSTMPVSKIQQREEAIQVAKMGMLDPEGLYEKLDWSNRKEIVNRMKQGPIGEVLQKISAALPPQVMNQIAQIAQMPMKDFQQALKRGEIQPVQLPGPQGPNPIQQQGVQLEFGEKQARISKDQAEAQRILVTAEETKAKIALINEQIITERVKQQVHLKGIEFDDQKLIMERAKVVKDLESSVQAVRHKDRELDIKKSDSEAKMGPYNERGMTSNNMEVSP